MEIQVILRLLHLWSTKTLVGKAQDELQVSTQYQKKNCSTVPEYNRLDLLLQSIGTTSYGTSVSNTLSITQQLLVVQVSRSKQMRAN